MKKMIVMGIPHHANIGDNAIAIAEEQLLDKYFPQYQKYYMPENNLHKCVKRAKEFIKDEDIIFLHGGGNIGDTYKIPEEGRREVIKVFPNNKIIIFPQTLYFSNTEDGKKELELSKQVYSNHNNLVILAREEKSYNFAKENFSHNKVYLTPDIVMTLSKTSNKERNGALLLFRGDKEKVLSDDKIDQIKSSLNNMSLTSAVSDMDLRIGIVNTIGDKQRNKIVNDKLEECQNAEMVITDRLHGMIFAAITSTPCVVFGNFNHKISESYKWLKNLDYIKFCNDIEDIETDIKQVINAKNKEYDNTFAEETIVNILKKEIE